MFKVLVVTSVTAVTSWTQSPSSSTSSQVLEFGTEDEAEYAIWKLHQSVSNGNGESKQGGVILVTSIRATGLYKITKPQPWHPK
jgi:hypothetical protein